MKTVIILVVIAYLDITALVVKLVLQDITADLTIKVILCLIFSRYILNSISYVFFAYFLGDFCKPCNCSGNINVDDPSSCDSVSGDCLRCLNNTFGAACNLCAPGYYGDAVVLKNCQS